MWGCGGGFCCSVPQYGQGRGGEEEGHTQEHTHTHTHTGTYTRMLHLRFSDLPLKKTTNDLMVKCEMALHRRPSGMDCIPIN